MSAPAPAPAPTPSPAILLKARVLLFDEAVARRARELGVSEATVHAKHLHEPAISKAYDEMQMAKHAAHTPQRPDPGQAEQITVDKQRTANALEEHVKKLAANRNEPYGRALTWALANDDTTQSLYAEATKYNRGDAR